jgi:hypothetical protein
MLSTYYALKSAVMHEISRYCSDNFLKKHFEEMYLCYRKEYEPLFGERAFDDIKDIVEDFKAFYGEE